MEVPAAAAGAACAATAAALGYLAWTLAASRRVCFLQSRDGFLGARIGPVTTLAFHPTRMLLAVGATDSVLSIYSS